ncbi:MAG: hypothetical protein B7Z55_00235 [Planctomycetales bacterium 12-60-4]|nr:MAG: hypothetical protein B7Z55_00235 [Planctomycetales bacterium 12-60-4]
MQRLVEGVHHFREVGFSRHKELFSRLGSGQNPEACFITCCDSRVDPNLITNSEPGQLFIVRNVGNLVPCHGTSNNGELAAVEFAIAELGVQDVIVCGHTGCGAMKALLGGQGSPTIQRWLIHAEATREIIRERYSHLDGDDLLTAAAEENVLVQMEHLRTLPVIASRLAQGRVHLHGWMFKIATGEVFAYDSDLHHFLPMSPSDAYIEAAGARSNAGRSQSEKGKRRRKKPAVA